MIGAGILNAVSFYCLATALQHLNVVYVHIINASQAAMAALAGVLIFAEPLTGYLIFGICLTAVGLLLPGYNSLNLGKTVRTTTATPAGDEEFGSAIPLGDVLADEIS